MRLKRDSKGRFLPRGRDVRRSRGRRRRSRRANPGGFLGLPFWVWLVGGAAVVYLLTRKSSAAPDISVMPGGGTAQAAVQAAAAAAAVEGYRGVGAYGRY